MREIRQKDIQRIVVRGANWVGDAVMSVAALRRLRQVFPNAHITLAVRSWAQDIFADAPFVDSLMLHERHDIASIIKQIRDWRRHKFDLAVLFPNAFEAALIPFLARVPVRVGYATDGRRALLTQPLQLPEWRDRRSETFYYLNIVSEIESMLNPSATVVNGEPDCSLSISEFRQTQAVEQLKSQGASELKLTIAICPGSINSRAKRWPAERYARLADRLIEEQNADVLLIGSKDEVDVSAEVRGSMKYQPIDLTGKTDLAGAVAILSVVDLVVSNDTGPAHIAASLGRPTLVIFGPTNPLTTRPFSEAAEIVRQPPDCAPCMLRDCPIDHRCMTAISVEEVFAKALALMQAKSGESVRNERSTKSHEQTQTQIRKSDSCSFV
ncbi:MAG TPA: lipopolysaccharide heptosyltransferase II [Pyrinomonadaceae bacterium]|nr:lipopolysaccharide heptosyltransferase II [Pyrinomonadaceae bacterium]